MERTSSTKALAFLRAATGMWLLWLALPNLDRSFIDRLPDTLDLLSATNPYPAYRWLLHHGAYPYIETLGSILCVGQLMAGCALLIGFFTRIVGSIGALYALNLFLAAGHLSPYHQGLCITLLLLMVTLVVGDAGLYTGVDGIIFKGKSEGPSGGSKPKFKNKKQQKAVEALTRQVQKSAKKLKKKSKVPTG